VKKSQPMPLRTCKRAYPSMRLVVGRRPIQLPSRPCVSDDVWRAVGRINPPFVVNPGSEGRFSVRRRVFFSAEDIRVECENEGELGLACKLIMEDHNRWQDCDDDNQRCMRETELAESEMREREENDTSSDEDEAHSDEDICIEEWHQRGYKWFKGDDVAYI
jgi:hypothetical protein